MGIKKPKVKLEIEYIYTNKFNKKKIRFSPKKDEIVATFEPQTTEETVRGIMGRVERGVSQRINLDLGFAVFRVGPDEDTETTAESLATHPEIINTIPVMVDDEGLTRYFLPDELTVQFKEGVSKERIERIIKEKGSQILVEQRTTGYYTLVVPEGKGLFETLREFSALEEVAFAEPSEAGFDDALAYIPDDPYFSLLWGLHNTITDCDIDAPEAWEAFTRGNPNVIVTVIDTGVDLDHPDLQANILPRGTEDWDFSGPGTVPQDTSGHGTHVAGTAAAVDNSIGVIGVASNCRIMPLKVNLTTGMNQNRADAINYVAVQAAFKPEFRYVINCSWKTSGDHSGVHNAIRNAVNNNVVVIFAAGNYNWDIDVTPMYPAVYPEVIAVAATDRDDKKASFSNFGTKVDVSAPGVSIYSTFLNDTYASLDGTSMAAPHAAGVAALIWSRNRTLTNKQVRQILEDNCDNIDDINPSYAGKLGKGRINAYKALNNTPTPSVDVYIRDFVGDTGAPHVGAISASPDIILRPTEVANPQATYGEGSGTENNNTLGHEAEAGQDNYLYVRVRNRGGNPATDVKAFVYWAPVSTLITPNLWTLLGTVAIPEVPTGNVLTVSDAIIWEKSKIPATGHYCFVGLIGNLEDPVPDPNAFYDWDNFCRFIRENNNVTWRNFNVVNNLPDEMGYVSLPFFTSGTPDKARRMQLEVVMELPRGARAWLEIPAYLIEGVGALNDIARLPVNPHGPTRLRARFPARSKGLAKLRVHIPKEYRKNEYEIYVRHLYEGKEVGRITWRLVPPERIK